MTPVLKQTIRRRRSRCSPDKNQEETRLVTNQGDRSTEQQQMQNCSFRSTDDCCLIRDEPRSSVCLFFKTWQVRGDSHVSWFLKSYVWSSHMFIGLAKFYMYKVHTCLLMSVGWTSSVCTKFTHVYTKSACFSKTQLVKFLKRN